MKILFQGDSITDAGRNRADITDLGPGYPKFAVEFLKAKFPDKDLEFVNLGISGDQTKDLVARLESDFVNVGADIVSILIGINDVWHYSEKRDWLPDEVFEERYRTVLEAVKKTGAKIMMIEPFLIPVEDKLYFREDLDPKIQVIRRLAREYADVYMPTDGLLASAYIGDDAISFAPDGVHPTPKCAELIGKLYCEYISKLIK